jgi:hypothetical protein
MAVRCIEAASDVTVGDCAQKFLEKIVSGVSLDGVFGITNESWLPGIAKIGTG